jgi:hypothetical protein
MSKYIVVTFLNFHSKFQLLILKNTFKICVNLHSYSSMKQTLIEYLFHNIFWVIDTKNLKK